MRVTAAGAICLTPRAWAADPDRKGGPPPVAIYLSRADWETAVRPDDLEEWHEWMARNVAEVRPLAQVGP